MFVFFTIAWRFAEFGYNVVSLKADTEYAVSELPVGCLAFALEHGYITDEAKDAALEAMTDARQIENQAAIAAAAPQAAILKQNAERDRPALNSKTAGAPPSVKTIDDGATLDGGDDDDADLTPYQKGQITRAKNEAAKAGE
jgi:hypothetical protein